MHCGVCSISVVLKYQWALPCSRDGQTSSASTGRNCLMTNYAYRLLGGEPRPGHEVLPVWKRFGRSSQGQAWSFYGIAALCGIIVQALIFTSRSSRFSRATGDEQPQCSIFGPTSVPALVNEAYTRPGSGQHVVSYENRWSLGALYDMVSRTKGYYARDYSLWLGWNNVWAGTLQRRFHAHLSSDGRCAIS